MTLDRDKALQMDRNDGLAGFRDRFHLREGLIYFDGNSLGPMQQVVQDRVRQCLEEEWGQDLIASWNKAGWYTMPQRLGQKIAPLIGAGPDDVVVTDSTSVNLFKVMAAALSLIPDRKVIVSERSNFPTDLYMVEGLAQFAGRGHILRLVDGPDEIAGAIDEDVAVVLLTEVNYRTGWLHDMKAITSMVHEAGALAIWDLAHTAGALPVGLADANADFAVGCSYKYLNGGPGAPAFLYVAPRFQDRVTQPLSGWFGHADPFALAPSFEAAPTIRRFLTGTPPVLSMVALDAALDIWSEVSLAELREKSVRLSAYFIDLVEEKCRTYDFHLVSPRQIELRGSQVCFSHENAYPIIQALIAKDVIGDFRGPDILRFGFAPLYVRYVDIYEAVERLADIMRTDFWNQERFMTGGAVT